MICKDCLPVFYTPEELGAIPELERLDWPEFSSSLDLDHRLILKHVELCPRHATEEAAKAMAASPLPEWLELAEETIAYLESGMWVRAEPDLEVTNELWNKWKAAIAKARQGQ